MLLCLHRSTVLFKYAVKAISKHGFHTSPYPVILTIDVMLRYVMLCYFVCTAALCCSRML
jgi:hypothetical protein